MAKLVTLHDANGEVIYPQTISDMDYSTSEQDTGCKWIDGKKIYRKTINFGALPNASSKNVNHGVANIAQVVKIDGVVSWSNDTWSPIPLVYKSADSAYNSEFQVTTTYIHCATDQNRSNISAIITIYYTKTTD